MVTIGNQHTIVSGLIVTFTFAVLLWLLINISNIEQFNGNFIIRDLFSTEYLLIMKHVQSFSFWYN